MQPPRILGRRSTRNQQRAGPLKGTVKFFGEEGKGRRNTLAQAIFSLEVINTRLILIGTIDVAPTQALARESSNSTHSTTLATNSSCVYVCPEMLVWRWPQAVHQDTKTPVRARVRHTNTLKTRSIPGKCCRCS